ncbi:MAG: RHS repeat-associated core domain-containing protein, partial [Planctomycetota bacterium]
GNPYVLEPNFADDPDGKTDWANPYYFTGRRADFLDGNKLTLQINRHRYYDYYTGRWLTQDPRGVDPAARNGYHEPWVFSQYGNSLNIYEYVRNGPLNWLDPTGLRCCDKCVPGKRDYEILDEILVPHGSSPSGRLIVKLVSTGSTLVDVALLNPFMPANHVIIDLYITSIIGAVGRSIGWDMYLKIQEKKCKKVRCGFLWLRKRYNWRRDGAPYYHRCESGLYSTGLGRYGDWDDAVASKGACKSDFESDFNRNRDVDFDALLCLIFSGRSGFIGGRSGFIGGRSGFGGR